MLYFILLFLNIDNNKEMVFFSLIVSSFIFSLLFIYLLLLFFAAPGVFLACRTDSLLLESFSLSLSHIETDTNGERRRRQSEKKIEWEKERHLQHNSTAYETSSVSWGPETWTWVLKQDKRCTTIRRSSL